MTFGQRRAAGDHRALPALAVPLTAILTAAYILAVGGVTLWGARTVIGRDGRWSPIVALLASGLVVALTLRPVCRWLRDGVRELVTLADDAQLLAVRHRPGEGPSEVAGSLGTLLCDIVDLTGVEIVVWPSPTGSAAPGTWRAGTSVVIGDLHTAPIEVPMLHGGRDFGVVRATPRRRRGLGGAASTLLVDLVGHAGLVVSSAVLREELETSRELLVMAREEERRRLRRELHDGLGPSLAAMKLQTSAIRRRGGTDAFDASALDDLRTMIGEATDEVRRVVEDLRPPLLDDCGLIEAIRSLRFVPQTLALRVVAPSPMPQLPAAIEVALYRIATEAVHNTVRHAEASNCTVAIEVGPRCAHMTVSDDGCGVPVPLPPGVGTAAMSERARELGGTVSINAAPSRGTCVTAALPLRDEAGA